MDNPYAVEEIIQELTETSKDGVSSDPSTPDSV